MKTLSQFCDSEKKSLILVTKGKAIMQLVFKANLYNIGAKTFSTISADSLVVRTLRCVRNHPGLHSCKGNFLNLSCSI